MIWIAILVNRLAIIIEDVKQQKYTSKDGENLTYMFRSKCSLYIDIDGYFQIMNRC